MVRVYRSRWPQYRPIWEVRAEGRRPSRHRRMRRGGGQGGLQPPPAFGQLSFLGSGGPFFGQQQWWEGGVFQFSGGRMTSRGQCPRGGGCL